MRRLGGLSVRGCGLLAGCPHIEKETLHLVLIDVIESFLNVWWDARVL